MIKSDLDSLGASSLGTHLPLSTFSVSTITLSVRNLGVISDTLSFKNHALSESPSFSSWSGSSLSDISSLLLPSSSLCQFVLTRLDYCSFLLFSPARQSPESSEHSWSHCIPQVKGRLCPGLAAISGSRRIRYRVLHGLFSICLSLAGQLALTSCFLTVPRIRLDKFGRRSFSFPDPSLWNALSLSLIWTSEGERKMRAMFDQE